MKHVILEVILFFMAGWICHYLFIIIIGVIKSYITYAPIIKDINIELDKKLFSLHKRIEDRYWFKSNKYGIFYQPQTKEFLVYDVNFVNVLFYSRYLPQHSEKITKKIIDLFKSDFNNIQNNIQFIPPPKTSHDTGADDFSKDMDDFEKMIDPVMYKIKQDQKENITDNTEILNIILDKISIGGYDKLSIEDKNMLEKFRNKI